MLKILYKPLIAAILMTIVIVFLKLNMFLLIIIGAFVYFAALFLLRTFDEKDYSLVRRLARQQ